MELINKSMKNVLNFISSVQDSCDKHRLCVGYRWQQEYAAYLAEWKQSQSENKSKRQTGVKNIEDNTPKDDIVEEFEELALADSLLRKARSIRSKNQKIINGFVGVINSDLHAKLPISSSTKEKDRLNRKIPHSKSDFITTCHKNTIVPRSKSATVPFVPKEDKSCRNNYSSLPSKGVSSNHIKHINKTSDRLSVSSRDLDVLKRLCVNVPNGSESKQKRNLVISDSSENIHWYQVKAQPTSREFFNLVKGQLDSNSTQLKLKLWYPFLSCKNETQLTSVRCNTFCSIQKMCNMLHSIQETMMWIDLLYLIERDIYPILISGEKDVNLLRLCSYLLGLFHHNSQRIPILDPNG